MFSTIRAACLLPICLLGETTFGSVFNGSELSIDFANRTEAKAKAAWSENWQVTEAGLAQQNETAETTSEGWFHTLPLAIGAWYRPVVNTQIEVFVGPLPPPLQAAGQTFSRDPGLVYIRFSPDRKHWSTWQLLRHDINAPSDSFSIFRGVLGVPEKERQNYVRLLDLYRNMDVDWPSDEEAAVKWLLQAEPYFFKRSLPFIGYVEFLYEGRLEDQRRIRTFKANLSYGAGGISSPPKNPEAVKARAGEPWSFAATDPSS